MGRNYVHSLKSSSRIFIYFVVSLEEVWESVLHIFLKARLLALKKKHKTAWIPSAYSLLEKPSQLYIYRSSGPSSFRQSPCYVLLTKK